MQLKRVEDAINAIKNGEMIIIMDDEGRENEGDIVYAGEFSSPQKVNFLVTEARGVLCVSLTDKLAKKLDFPLMVDKNSSNHETAFTVSVDAKRAKTGVSAFERDMTIKLICDDNSRPSDFAKPGHIFPLIAKKGGVLVRTGHTEASVDICKLAGLKPIAVICELMKKDGTMASNNDNFVMDFATQHGLKVLYVSDLVHYKFQYEVLVENAGAKKTRFFGAECERIDFIDHLDSRHIVYKFSGDNLCKSKDSPSLAEGDKGGGCNTKKNSGAKIINSESTHPLAPSAREGEIKCVNYAPFVRFHSFNNTLQLLENNEFETLNKSVAFLRENGGFLVCLNNANNEMSAKNASEVSKVVGIGAQILKSLKISDFTLLSTRKNHQYIALNGFGLTIKSEVLI